MLIASAKILERQGASHHPVNIYLTIDYMC